MFDLTTYVKKWRIRQLKTVFSTLDTLCERITLNQVRHWFIRISYVDIRSHQGMNLYFVLVQRLEEEYLTVCYDRRRQNICLRRQNSNVVSQEPLFSADPVEFQY